MPTVTLTPLAEAHRELFLEEELANYASEQEREAGWPPEESLARARTELGPILERSVATPGAMPPALVGRYAAPFVGRDGVRHLMQLEGAVNDHALADVVWEKISAPSLVVRGDADSWVAGDVAATVFSRIPHAELRILKGVARLAPEDAPDEVIELLRTWIGPETQVR